MHTTRKTHDGIPRMPALFGRQPGPRQRPDRQGLWPADSGQMTATWVVVESDPEPLRALLPERFELTSPFLIAEAVTLEGLPWLAGRGYEMLMLSLPVTFRGESEYKGRLELVTWENFPDAIISGREELGWNKLYADRMGRRTSEDGKSVFYSASWGGTTFFDMRVDHDKLLPRFKDWRKGPLMHYRVFPRTGHWGELEVEQVTGAGFEGSLPALRSFNPPHLIPLVGVVAHAQSRPDNVQRAMAFYRTVGKKPMLLRKEVPGFVANRLQAALLREAVLMVKWGVVTVNELDDIVTSSFGLRWATGGPFLSYHLGGGPGGFTNFLKTFSRGLQLLWLQSKLTPVCLNKRLNQKLLSQIAASFGQRSMEALQYERDQQQLLLWREFHHQD